MMEYGLKNRFLKNLILLINSLKLCERTKRRKLTFQDLAKKVKNLKRDLKTKKLQNNLPNFHKIKLHNKKTKNSVKIQLDQRINNSIKITVKRKIKEIILP